MSLTCKVLNKNEFWKFVHSKQSNGSKKKIQLLRDDTYN